MITLSNKQLQTVISIMVLTGIWLGIAFTTVHMLTSLNSIIPPSRTALNAGVSPNDTIIAQAFNLAINRTLHEYKGSAEPPFRPTGRSASEAITEPAPGGGGGNNTAPGRDYTRRKLVLKGILTQDKPLAILEDARGQTQIMGVGDTLEDQKIVRIDINRVTLSDRGGTYELLVKE